MFIKEFVAVLGLALAGASTIVLVVHFGLKIFKPKAFNETRPRTLRELITGASVGAMATASGQRGIGLSEETDGGQVRIGNSKLSDVGMGNQNSTSGAN